MALFLRSGEWFSAHGYSFLDDMGYGHRWNPRGWYRRIDEEHFRAWHGVRGYLDFLRREGGFQPIGRNS